MSTRDHRQDQWDAGQREHDERVALAAEQQPGQEWVVLPGIHGWVRRKE